MDSREILRDWLFPNSPLKDALFTPQEDRTIKQQKLIYLEMDVRAKTKEIKDEFCIRGKSAEMFDDFVRDSVWPIRKP